MEIERQIENSHQMYIQEWEKYFKPIKVIVGNKELILYSPVVLLELYQSAIKDIVKKQIVVIDYIPESVVSMETTWYVYN